MAKPPGRVYLAVISFFDQFVPRALQPFWNHPAGPKTVFFYMPCVKWGLVLATLGDLRKPAYLISIEQSCSICFTGLLWARFAHQIKPKNYSLMSVNLFIFATNFYMCARGVRYQYFSGPPES